MLVKVKEYLVCTLTFKFFLLLSYNIVFILNNILNYFCLPSHTHFKPESSLIADLGFNFPCIDGSGYFREFRDLKSYVCVRANSLQLCLTLCDPVDCSPPGSSVHGILQARILEWVAMPSSRESTQPRN